MAEQGADTAVTRPEGSAVAQAGAEVSVNASLLLIAAGRMAREQAEAGLEGLGLALRHVSALGHLSREPGLSYSELARRAGITVQSMQATLAQLERLGAIERRTPPGRGRSAQLVTTSGGQELLARARAVMGTLDGRLAETLGADAHATLTALLEQLVRAPSAP